MTIMMIGLKAGNTVAGSDSFGPTYFVHSDDDGGGDGDHGDGHGDDDDGHDAGDDGDGNDANDCGKDDCATKSDSFGLTYFVGDDSFGLVHDGHTGNLGSQFSIFKCKVCQLLFFFYT